MGIWKPRPAENQLQLLHWAIVDSTNKSWCQESPCWPTQAEPPKPPSPLCSHPPKKTISYCIQHSAHWRRPTGTGQGDVDFPREAFKPPYLGCKAAASPICSLSRAIQLSRDPWNSPHLQCRSCLCHKFQVRCISSRVLSQVQGLADVTTVWNLYH